MPSAAPLPSASSPPVPVPLFTGTVSGASVSWLAGLGLAATLVGEALAPALKGSRAGIEDWIALCDQVGALLSHALAIYGLGLAVWLCLLTVRATKLSYWHRMAVVPLVTLVTVLAGSAMADSLSSSWTAWMGIGATLLTCVAAPVSLRRAHTRPAGLVLVVIGMASFLELLARGAALHATHQSLSTVFQWARTVTTLSFTLKVTSVLVVVLWLGARRWRWMGPVSVLVLVGLLGLSFCGFRGSSYGASWGEVLVARVLGGLLRRPAPLVGPVLRSVVELSLLTTAFAVLWVRREPRPLLAIVALALLSRAAADVPLCALMLAVAALLAPLAAVCVAPTQQRPTASEGCGRADGARASARGSVGRT
ncbi:hypothetical protein ACFL5O_03680 [Myxococcota bacterium]